MALHSSISVFPKLDSGFRGNWGFKRKMTGITVSYQVPQPCQGIGTISNMAQQMPSSFFSAWRYRSSQTPAQKRGILSLDGDTCCPLKCNGTVKAQRQLTDPSQTASNWVMLPGWKALMASKGPLSQRQTQANGSIRQSFFRPCANYKRSWKAVFPSYCMTGLGYMKRQSVRAEGLLDCKCRGWGCVLQALVWEKAKEKNEHPLSQDRGFLGSSREQWTATPCVAGEESACCLLIICLGILSSLVSNQQAVRNEWSTKRLSHFL